MASTKAHINAVKRYNQKAYDVLYIYIKSGMKQIISDHCEKTGQSVNGFVCRAIMAQMERDNSDNR